jgi:ABC-2 type transport system ATP-binding protein
VEGRNMIQLKNVSKTIKGKTVLANINVVFQDGKVYGLKGINGSGKTMLMRMVSGLIYPTEGAVFIDGKELGKDISFPEQMGILIENPVFLDSYTGFDNLKMLASINGKASEQDIADSLRRVGLDPADKRKYRKYSLGMKQRMGIAAALMEQPKILILDEPLNALDTAGIHLFSEIIKKEREKKTLILISCHDERKLEEYSDILIALENGKIVGVEGEEIEES